MVVRPGNALLRESEIGGYPDQLLFHPRNADLMLRERCSTQPRLLAGQAVTLAAAYPGAVMADGPGMSAERCLPDRLQASIDDTLCLEDSGGSLSLFAATTAGEVYASHDSGEHWALICFGVGADPPRPVTTENLVAA